MSPPDQQVEAGQSDDHAGCDSYLELPSDEGPRNGERHQDDGHRQQVPDREGHEGGDDVAPTPAHQPGRDGQRPAHSRVDGPHA